MDHVGEETTLLLEVLEEQMQAMAAHPIFHGFFTFWYGKTPYERVKEQAAHGRTRIGAGSLFVMSALRFSLALHFAPEMDHLAELWSHSWRGKRWHRPLGVPEPPLLGK